MDNSKEMMKTGSVLGGKKKKIEINDINLCMKKYMSVRYCVFK